MDMATYNIKITKVINKINYAFSLNKYLNKKGIYLPPKACIELASLEKPFSTPLNEYEFELFNEIISNDSVEYTWDEEKTEEEKIQLEQEKARKWYES